MPQSSQNLYFHLGMNADDDGFCEHFALMRMTDSKPDDLKVLQAKGFVSVFDDRVLVITDWKENNYLRNDRYSPSKYLAVYKKELALLSQNKVSTTGIPTVDNLATQVRLGKVRLGKDKPSAQDAEEISEIINLFKEVNPSYERLFGMPPQRNAAHRLLKTHGKEKLTSMVTYLPKSNSVRFAPTITTPVQFEQKLGELIAWSQKQKEIISKGKGIA